MTNLANIALTGLRAAQAGLAVTGNNIANQGTDGYSRQDVVEQSALSNFTGSGYFGQGVDVMTVRRAYSDFLNAQASQSASALSYLSTYADRMGAMMNRLGDVDTGVNASLNDLYAAMGDFSERPSEAASRGAVLASAESVAARFRSLSEDLSALRAGSNQQIGSTVGQINVLVESIASYNEKIGMAAGAAAGQEPNHLLDQRDTLVRELGKLTGIQTSTQGAAVNVFLSNGQPLVVGGRASRLDFDGAPASGASGSSLTLSVGTGTGAGMRLRESDLDSGQLGALLQFRDNELADAGADLGRLAIRMAAAYNQQQQFGLDANGAPGAALFALGAPAAIDDAGNAGDAILRISIADSRGLTGDDYELARVGGDYVLTRAGSGDVVATFDSMPQDVEGLRIEIASGALADGDSFRIDVTGQAGGGLEVLLKNPSGLAGASPMQTVADPANTGTGVASRLRSSDAAAADYTSAIEVVFTSASAYELRNPDGSVAGAGSIPPAMVSHNGWAFDVAGTPAVGDRYTVEPGAGDPSGDNRNALALAGLATAKLADGSTLTDRYAALVAGVGTRAASLNVAQAAQQAAYNEASDAEQAVSGVNLDEEGARLIRYQQAYAAAGKMLGMASQLFDDLLAAMG